MPIAGISVLAATLRTLMHVGCINGSPRRTWSSPPTD
jgi:hypothetical protein